MNVNSKHVMKTPGIVEYSGKYWSGQIKLKRSPKKVANSSINPLSSVNPL